MFKSAFNSILSKFTFLHLFASKIICLINPLILHNVGKYLAIFKVHYLSLFDGIKGDYLEFGIYKGSSFIHSINAYRKNKRILSSTINRSFFGFDSFKGFGNISKIDQHPFYKDMNFSTDFKKTENRIKKSAKKISFKIK